MLTTPHAPTRAGVLTMFSRVALPRRSLPLLAGVFLAGAGIGAGAVALTGHRGGRRVVEKVLTQRTPTQIPMRRHPVPARQPARGPQPVLVPPGAAASFAALIARLPGQVGLAVAPLAAGPIEAFGPARVAHAWSTSKVPVLVTLLRQDEATSQVLNSQQANEATLALEQSDNASIEALFSDLEERDGGLTAASGSVQQTLRAAGDQKTMVNTAPNDEGFTTYGQTEWSLAGEVTFYRALARGCLLDRPDTAYVLALMRNVIPSQRWGAGSAGYPSYVPVAFKGGWGPDSAGKYQVRQTAIIGSGSRGYVVSMLALPESGAFSDGTAMLSALAAWARGELELGAAGAPAACGGSQ